MSFNTDWILHEDDALLVINKPTDLSVLEDRSGADNLWRMLSERGRYFPVHRIDKGTSGVLLIARTQAVQSKLTKQFAARGVRKFYVADVVGEFPSGGTLTVNLPLRPGRKSRYRVAGERAAIERRGSAWLLNTLPGGSGEAGVDAITRIRLLKTLGTRSRLLAEPLTGRTHQLRVHLSWIGHAIAGDHLYGKSDDPVQRDTRLKLHCHRVVIPGRGTFSAPVPWT